MLLDNRPDVQNIPRQNRQKSFLLLEVLLALTILSAGIMAVIKVYSVALRAQRHARYQTSAFLLASNLQTEIEIAAIEEREGHALIGSKLFEWNIEIESIYAQELEMLSVEVKWTEQSKEYEISLSNLYPKSFINELFKK